MVSSKFNSDEKIKWFNDCYHFFDASSIKWLFFEQYFEALIYDPLNYFEGYLKAGVCNSLKEMISLEVKKYGEKSCFKFSLGVCCYHLMEFDKAKEYFKRSYDIAGEYRFAHYQTGANTVLSMSDIATLIGNNGFLSSTDISFGNFNVDVSKTTVIVCCDSNYFKAYIVELCASFSSFEDICQLHIHIVNENDCDEIKALLIKSYNFVSFSFSNYQGDSAKTYYATVRFLLCSRLLENCCTDVIFYDADIVFESSFRAFHKRFISGDFDVALNRNSGFQARYPWTTINANCFGVKFNTTGRVWASIVSKTANYFFPNSKEGTWWFDQNLLTMTSYYFFVRRREFKVMNNFVTGNGKITTPKKKSALLEVLERK